MKERHGKACIALTSGCRLVKDRCANSLYDNESEEKRRSMIVLRHAYRHSVNCRLLPFNAKSRLCGCTDDDKIFHDDVFAWGNERFGLRPESLERRWTFGAGRCGGFASSPPKAPLWI